VDVVRDGASSGPRILLDMAVVVNVQSGDLTLYIRDMKSMHVGTHAGAAIQLCGRREIDVLSARGSSSLNTLPIPIYWRRGARHIS